MAAQKPPQAVNPNPTICQRHNFVQSGGRSPSLVHRALGVASRSAVCRALLSPCDAIVTQMPSNRNATSVLGRACARSSTLYTQRHTPRLHRLLDTQA